MQHQAERGQRRAQLMRGGAHERAPRLLLRREPPLHRRERAREVADLVAVAVLDRLVSVGPTLGHLERAAAQRGSAAAPAAPLARCPRAARPRARRRRRPRSERCTTAWTPPRVSSERAQHEHAAGRRSERHRRRAPPGGARRGRCARRAVSPAGRAPPLGSGRRGRCRSPRRPRRCASKTKPRRPSGAAGSRIARGELRRARPELLAARGRSNAGAPPASVCSSDASASCSSSAVQREEHEQRGDEHSLSALTATSAAARRPRRPQQLAHGACRR